MQTQAVISPTSNKMIHLFKAEHLHKHFSELQGKKCRRPRSCKSEARTAESPREDEKFTSHRNRQTFPEREQLFLSPENTCFVYLRVLVCAFSCLHVWGFVFINFWSERWGVLALLFFFFFKVSNCGGFFFLLNETLLVKYPFFQQN